MTARTTVYLDESLLNRLRRFIPSRGLSSLVNKLLSEQAAKFEQAEIKASMREGYLATRQERLELNAEWQVADGEGWPA
jgi:hypothetical protein